MWGNSILNSNNNPNKICVSTERNAQGETRTRTNLSSTDFKSVLVDITVNINAYQFVLMYLINEVIVI